MNKKRSEEGDRDRDGRKSREEELGVTEYHLVLI